MASLNRSAEKTEANCTQLKKDKENTNDHRVDQALPRRDSRNSSSNLSPGCKAGPETMEDFGSRSAGIWLFAHLGRQTGGGGGGGIAGVPGLRVTGVLLVALYKHVP